MTAISTLEAKSQSKAAKWGWGILFVMSALLTFGGIGWFISLPQMALENIAEYASLDPAELMSAFGIITLIARGYGAGYAVLGLMALLVALEGYRNGTRWAWITMWNLVLAYAAIAGIFMLAGETYVLSLGILSFAVITVVGLFLARRGLVQ